MDKERLLQLLREPSSLSQTDVQALSSCAQEYPYFQTAHTLLLKGTKFYYPDLYATQLKKTAAYSTDRSSLFNYIHDNDDLKTNEMTVNTTKLMPNINPDTLITENTPSDIITNENELITKEEEEKVVLNFNTHEPHLFLEWLQVTKKTEILLSTKDAELKKEHDLSRKYEIIAQFINQNPKLSPLKNKTENANIALNSVEENQNLVTETLAKIYIEQRKYDKAIQAFQSLSLKYPEKSDYFANQIAYIKNIDKEI